MREKPSYYSFLTADVRYDDRLKPNEKILFSEITALTESTGACWASNEYFSRLYKVDKSTVSRWITKLKKVGYIDVTLLYKDGTKEVDKRIITIKSRPTDEIINDLLTKKSIGYGQKNQRPIDEKVKENTTRVNTTSNNKKDMCESSSHDKPKTKLEQVRDDFEIIWKEYPSKRRRDKEKCFTRYKNAIKDGETRENVYRGLMAMNKEIAEKGTENEFIRLSSTWFNNRNWNDYNDLEKEKEKEVVTSGSDWGWGT